MSTGLLNDLDPPRNFSSSIWNKLTQPSPELVDVETRHQAQLLSSITLIVVPLVILALILAAVFRGPQTIPPVSYVAMLASAGIYSLSRTKYAEWAKLIFISLIPITIFSILFSDGTPQRMPLLAIGILVSSIFLKIRFLTLFIGLNIVGAVLISLAGTSPFESFYISLAFLSIFSAITMALKHYRDELEIARQREVNILYHDLQKNEFRLRQIIENMPIMMNAFAQDGTILMWNRECERVTGYLEKEVVENPNALSLFYPDENYRQELLTRLAQNRTQYKGLERTIRCKDGRERIISWSDISQDYPIEGWHSWSVGVDITELKNAEKEASQAKDILTLAVENMRDGFALFDHENRLLHCNQQYRDFYPSIQEKIVPGVEFEKIAEAIETTGDISWVEGISPESYYQSRLEAWQKGAVFEYKSKSGRWIQARDSLIEGGGKVGIRIDISERKAIEVERQKYSQLLEDRVEESSQELQEAQNQLIRQEKLAILGQMAGSVGHELRNPLGVISNAVYFLKIVLAESDKTTLEYLDIIQNRIFEAEKITADLLNLSRTGPTDPLLTSPEMLIADVLRENPPPPTIKVTTFVDSNLPAIFVDPQQIMLVLANLLTNAYQAIDDQGSVEIVGKSDEDQIQISIQDSGTGIPSKSLKMIFEPLFTTKSGGIGLGLSISKNLVEINEGTIQVVSSKENGSTFILKFPTLGK